MTRLALALALALGPSVAGATALDDALAARCGLDPRLTAAAAEAHAHPASFDALEQRALTHAQGLPAATVQSLVVRGEGDALAGLVGDWLAARGATPALARCAAVTGGGTTAVALVPRLVEPQAAAAGAVRRWRVSLPEGVTEAALVATAPDGSVTRHPLDARGEAGLALDRDGVWTLEVLATLPAGPAPVALWDERVGAAAEAAPAVDGSVTNDRHLLRVINGLRAGRGLAPLRRDPLLDRVARAHAERLARSGTVAHTPAPGDSPVDRLRAAGVTAERVAENLARARSLALAHARIARSPAHRANLLDEAVDALGVGVAHAGDMAYVVELFAARPTLAEP